jgi:hypothetical protein
MSGIYGEPYGRTINNTNIEHPGTVKRATGIHCHLKPYASVKRGKFMDTWSNLPSDPLIAVPFISFPRTQSTTHLTITLHASPE